MVLRVGGLWFWVVENSCCNFEMTDLIPEGAGVGVRHIHPLTIIDSPYQPETFWAFNLTPVETHKRILTYNNVDDMDVYVGVGSSPKRAAKQLLQLLVTNNVL